MHGNSKLVMFLQTVMTLVLLGALPCSSVAAPRSLRIVLCTQLGVPGIVYISLDIGYILFQLLAVTVCPKPWFPHGIVSYVFKRCHFQIT